MLNKIQNLKHHILRKIFINLIYYNDKQFIKWYFLYAKKLIKFKNIHLGKDCFIIGNGPSLRNMDISQLNNYYTFGLNKIYLLLNSVKLSIDYHVAVNSLVIDQSIEEIKKLNCTSFISYKTNSLALKQFNHVHFIMTQSPYIPYTFQDDLLNGIHEGYTVTFVAMQIAFYMGFKNIFLIGVDHNFVTHGNANEKQFLSEDDPNHFDKTYFKNCEWNLPDLESSELSYHLANYFFKKNNRQIFDATVNGKLNIFKRISYADAFRLANKK